MSRRTSGDDDTARSRHEEEPASATDTFALPPEDGEAPESSEPPTAKLGVGEAANTVPGLRPQPAPDPSTVVPHSRGGFWERYQRHRQRLQAKLGVEIVLETDERQLACEVFNLSTQSVFVRGEELLPVDTPVFFELPLPPDDSKVWMVGRVAWVRDRALDETMPRGMGIVFENLESATRDRIAILLDEPR